MSVAPNNSDVRLEASGTLDELLTRCHQLGAEDEETEAKRARRKTRALVTAVLSLCFAALGIWLVQSASHVLWLSAFAAAALFGGVAMLSTATRVRASRHDLEDRRLAVAIEAIQGMRLLSDDEFALTLDFGVEVAAEPSSAGAREPGASQESEEQGEQELTEDTERFGKTWLTLEGGGHRLTLSGSVVRTHLREHGYDHLRDEAVDVIALPTCALEEVEVRGLSLDSDGCLSTAPAIREHRGHWQDVSWGQRLQPDQVSALFEALAASPKG